MRLTSLQGLDRVPTGFAPTRRPRNTQHGSVWTYMTTHRPSSVISDPLFADSLPPITHLIYLLVQPNLSHQLYHPPLAIPCPLHPHVPCIHTQSSLPHTRAPYTRATETAARIAENAVGAEGEGAGGPEVGEGSVDGRGVEADAGEVLEGEGPLKRGTGKLQDNGEIRGGDG